MDSLTLFIYIMVFVILLIIITSALRATKTFFRMKRAYVKSPRFRGKSILIDRERFGDAVVIGIEKSAPDAGFVHMLSQNGTVFKEFYHNFEIEPLDNLETMGGMERPLWRKKGSKYSDTFYNEEKTEAEKRNVELAEELARQKVLKKIEVNESATLKDTVLDIIKEMKESQKVESVKVVK